MFNDKVCEGLIGMLLTTFCVVTVEETTRRLINEALDEAGV